jgi:GMP synthase-like glutamine amidotransferase
LGTSAVVLQAHYWEVKEAPAGFKVLASSDECRIQVIKHESKPVFGTQFHPEAAAAPPYDLPSPLASVVYPEGYAAERVAGKQILSNSFRITGVPPRDLME